MPIMGRAMDSRRIAITAGAVEVTAELDDTLTADAVWEALPFEAAASTWGDEIYFGIPVSAEEEPGSSAVVEMGAVAYWPPGSALCLILWAHSREQGDRDPRGQRGERVRQHRRRSNRAEGGARRREDHCRPCVARAQ